MKKTEFKYPNVHSEYMRENHIEAGEKINFSYQLKKDERYAIYDEVNEQWNCEYKFLGEVKLEKKIDSVLLEYKVYAFSLPSGTTAICYNEEEIMELLDEGMIAKQQNRTRKIISNVDRYDDLLC